MLIVATLPLTLSQKGRGARGWVAIACSLMRVSAIEKRPTPIPCSLPCDRTTLKGPDDRAAQLPSTISTRNQAPARHFVDRSESESHFERGARRLSRNGSRSSSPCGLFPL